MTWRTLQVHSVEPSCLKPIVEIERIKAQKLNAYQPCDCYWLLLVVDFWNSAQDQDIRALTDQKSVQISSPYAKIIIYKTGE